MDIGDIIKDYFWVIIALLFYLLAGRKKTKKDEKIVPERNRPGESAAGEARPGLQERLEQALREMQQQTGPTSTNVPVQSSAAYQTPLEAATASVPAEEVFSEPSRTTSPFEFHSTVPLHQRRTALDAARQTAPATAVAESASVSEFHEGHGLRYHSHSGEMSSSGRTGFREGHGLHYGESPTRPSRSGVPPAVSDDVPPFFRDEEDLRRAVIAAEILGPPRGRRVA